MTIASCGSVSALTLGLPNSSAIPAEKATLPKGLFVARIPVSAKTKQRLANDIETITMLSLLRPSNTRLAVGTRIPEVLAIGLRLHAKNAAIPTDIVELIAMQRKSGIVFVCVRDADFEGTKRQECAFAVRRALPGRAGHTPTFKVFVSDWKPAGEAMLDIGDQDAFSFFIGGGAGYAKIRYDNIRRVSGSNDVLDDGDWRFAWQATAGVRKAISSNVDATLRYRFFNANGKDDLIGVGGRAVDDRFRSHSLMAGVTFNF